MNYFEYIAIGALAFGITLILDSCEKQKIKIEKLSKEVEELNRLKGA